MKKSNINEEDKSKFRIHVDAKTLKNPTMTKKMADIQNANPYIEFDLEPTKGGNIPTMEDLAECGSVLEPEALITPQDKATIKYLSNVKDSKTGEISKPFTIGTQKYQMIRGLDDAKQIVMAVFAHDETDENGDNIIYSVDEFEKNIALPMLETMGLRGQDIGMVGDEPMTEVKDDTYEGYRHFFVNKETNEVKKFRTIEEMLSCGKKEEEEYMPTTKFKRFMTEKLFGKRNRLNELGTDQANSQPAQGPQSGDVQKGEKEDELTGKAKLLIQKMDEIRVIKNAMDSVKTEGSDKAKGIVLVSFAERIGVPRTKLSFIISTIKNISKNDSAQQDLAESKIITKKELMESLKSERNVIKTIKVKDIK